MRKPARIITGILLLLMLAALFAGFNARACAELYATHALGRKVTAGSLRVNFHPVTIILKDVREANAPWGRAPDMLEVRRIVAEPELKPLFTGRLILRRLQVEGASLLLERDAEGRGNWKKDGEAAAPSPLPLEAAARSRERFPAILNLSVKDSGVVMYTSGGAKLTIDFSDARIAAPDTSQPVTIHVSGAYNNIGVQMEIHAQSYDVFHDGKAPFAAEIDAYGATASLHGALTMLDPLDFDRVNGALHAGIKNTGEASAFFGDKTNWNVPLTLESNFAREGDSWGFTAMHGRFAANGYSGSRIHLQEGSRKEPDTLAAEVHFEKINIVSLLAKSGAVSEKDFPLAASDHPPMLLDAHVSADTLAWGTVNAAHFRAHALMAPGRNALEDISLAIFGGTLRASAVAETHHIALKAELLHAQAGQMMQAFGEEELFTGKLKTGISVAAAGGNLQEWLTNTAGKAHASLTDGAISRRLVRIASADLREVLHKDRKPVKMPCALAEVTFTHGRGTLSPFMIETEEGTLFGGGTMSLPHQALDLTFQTDPKTTSGLALNIPVHVGGIFAHPRILPAPKPGSGIDMEENRSTRCSADEKQ